MRTLLLALLAVALAVAAAAAQDDGAAASYVPRDDQVDALLRRARDLERQRRPADAARAYMLVEDRLEARRREDPTARPVVPVEGQRDLFVGADAAVRERVLALPPEGLEIYRAARDPRVADLLERWAAAPADPAPLEEIAARFSLATKAPEALARLADLKIERGELESAARILRDLPPAAREAQGEWIEARLAFIARLLASGERAAAAAGAWPMEGGGPTRAAEAPAGPVPGATRFLLPIPASEIGPAVREGFARRGRDLPLIYRPIAVEGLIVLADSKSVIALGETDGKVRWIYGAIDPADARPDPAPQPERLDNFVGSAAARGGRIFATLNRNTAPIYEGEAATRAADWRLVALDARTGRLLWDAAAPGGALAEVAREARYVTPPLPHGDRVFVGAVTGAGNLQAHVIAIDAASGAPLWRTFAGSASPDDFRALGSQAAPLATADGLVFFVPNLGAVLALDAASGSIRWAARYRSTPVASQKRIIRDGRRFALSAPRCLADVVVAFPQDAGAAVAFDRASGAERWRLERDGLEYVAGVAAGRLVLAGGGAALAIDPCDGRLAWRAGGLGPLRGAGFATAGRIYVPAADRISILAAESGALERTVHLDPLLERGGNLLVTPRGLYIAGAASIVALDDFEESLAAARRAAEARPGDAAALLELGRILARSGSAESALDLLERAAASPGDTGKEARAVGFAAARRAAEEAARGGRPAAALDHARRAVRLAPASPESVEFLKEQALALESAGHAAEAVEAYRALLALGADVEVPLAEGVGAPAGAWVRRRLAALRRTAGGAAFAAYDAAAAKEYEVALKAGTPEALERVVERFPATPREADALLSLALLYERRSVANLAIRCYAQHAQRYPDSPQAPSVLYKLLLLYEQTKRSDEARRTAEDIRARFGKDRIKVGEREVDLGAFARERLDAVAARDDRPSLPTGAAEDLRPSFQTWTDVGGEDPEILTPVGLDRSRAEVFLIAEGTALEARLVETGTRQWRRDVGPGFQKVRTRLAGGALVVSTARRIDGIDLETGRALWSWDAPALAAARLGAGAPAAAPVPPTRTAGGESEGAAAEAAPDLGAEPLDPLVDPEVPDPENPPERASPDGGVGPPGGGGPAPRVRMPRLAPIPISKDPDPIKGILALRDRVVVVVQHDVIALDAASGKVLWRVRRPETLFGDPAFAPGGARGRVVVTVESPARVIGLDADTGREAYAFALEAPDPRVTIRPVSTESGRLFCVVGQGEVFAIDGSLGAVLWRRKLPSGYWPRELEVSPDGGALCVLPHPAAGTDLPRLIVFDGATGATRFEDRQDRSRVSQVAFDGELLHVFAGDFMASRLRAIDWRTGAQRWEFKPQRGHAFGRMTIARDHIVLPQTGPTGPPVVFVLHREGGAIYTSFTLEGRRIVSATIQRGTIIISTNRGVFGYAPLDPLALEEEQAELAIAAAERPGDGMLRLLLADRRFKRGDLDGAVETLERALLSEGVTVDDYEALYGQLLGTIEARRGAERMEIARLSHPPEIDGDLRDWWPMHQSVKLAGPRRVAPIQGQEPVGIWRGEDDLGGTLWLGWDQKGFYFALDVEDSSLVPYDSEADEWKGDCLLIALDTLGNEGDFFKPDDNLLSLALTLPKKNKPQDEGEEEEPEGKFFVKRKDDGSGAIYEAAIPWSAFNEKGAQIDLATGPRAGQTFGFNVLVTDDDDRGGARKVLSWTPAVGLHREKAKLWQGFVPRRFAKIVLK